ncbi:disintegrin and metalloproteinase domain-containing protein 10 isoform X2 [Aplysia californica]|nr:disintegrin and metalloproteinase domain-containing protein 10 isoform X2 [Aplysia californica]
MILPTCVIRREMTVTVTGTLLKHVRAVPVIFLGLTILLTLTQFPPELDGLSDVHTTQNVTAFLCNDGIMRSSQICVWSAEVNDKEKQSQVKVENVLRFTFCGQNVSVSIGQHVVMAPDAQITYNSGQTVEIPVFREDVAQQLHSFYSGHFWFANETFPFSGEQSGASFSGRTFYFGAVLQMSCGNVVVAESLKAQDCFPCELISSDVSPPNTSVSSLESYEELLLELNDFESASNSEHVHKETRDRTMNQRSEYRRETKTDLPPPLTCSLHVVADHLFFKYIGSGNVLETVNMMFSLVNDADALFRSTDFDGDGQGDNIGFMVEKVTVYKTEQDADYKMARPYMTSDEYLRQFSFYNFEGHCLAVAFTFRDFNGVAGTSFPAYSNRRTPGGICQERLRINSHHVSFNTLVVTFMISGKMAQRSSVVLTLSHELGHSMGARHDGKRCISADENLGNYIMYKSSHFDMKPNNRRFSVCSIRTMVPVLKKKGRCLQSHSHRPHCGNSVPDVGEECDCGLSDICESIDPCCTPADHTGDVDKPCTTRKSQGKLCSPKLSPCCSEQCRYKKLKTREVCNIFDECTQKSFCNGDSEHCPSPTRLQNGSLCNDGRRVCEGNRCVMDVCSYHQLESCKCSDARHSCQLCCRTPNSKFCKPAEGFGIRNANGSPIFWEPGTPCVPGNFCNNAQQCVSSKETVAPLHSVFSGMRKSLFTSYLKKYWLYCVFVALSAIFLAGVVTTSLRRRPAYIKALRHRKMLSIFASGERLSSKYRKKMVDIHRRYAESIPEAQRQSQRHEDPALSHTQVVGRLRALFPEVKVHDLYHQVAGAGRTEEETVGLLLSQGFRMRDVRDLRSVNS